MVKCARHLHKITGLKNLVMAGGVALNCVGNGKILRHSGFEDIWVQPAAGDAGGALGVALTIWHHVLSHPRRVDGRDAMSASLLGPRFDEAQIKAFLDGVGAP